MAGVSASVGGSSVATGSPSQTDFIKTGQVDAGVLEETAVGHKQTSLRASMAYAQKVKQLRAIWVAAGGGDAGGG